MLLRGSLTTDHTCKFRSAGDNVGAVLGDGDCWLTVLIPVFDSLNGVAESPGRTFLYRRDNLFRSRAIRVNPRFFSVQENLWQPLRAEPGMRANSPVVVDGDFGSDVVVSIVLSPAFGLAVGKPIWAWVPSQNGLFAERPQRQRAITFLVWSYSPLEL